MILEHVDAVKALLEGDGVKVFTEPPQDVETRDAADFPYVVLYSDSGQRASGRLQESPHRADFIMQTTLVSLSQRLVMAERDYVIGALAMRVPQVTGWRCSRIEHLPGPSVPSRDTDIPGRPVFNAFDRWSFYSMKN